MAPFTSLGILTDSRRDGSADYGKSHNFHKVLQNWVQTPTVKLAWRRSPDAEKTGICRTFRRLEVSATQARLSCSGETRTITSLSVTT
jgi:hypothetical protein